MLFLRAAGPRSFRQDLWWFDVATAAERPFLTADQLAGGGDEALTPEELARRERARSSSRGIASYEVSKDGTSLLVPVGSRLFVVEIASALAGKPVVKELKSTHGAAIDARFSPDASMVACVRGGAVWVTRVSDGAEAQVSPTAEGDVSFGEAEFVAQEEMDRSQGYWWSPDSKAIAYQRTDVTGVEKFTIADPFDPAKPAKTWAYPRAGKKNAAVELWVAELEGVFENGASEPKATRVEWDHAAYPYMAKVTWAKGAPLCVLVQNRTQTEQVFYRVEEGTGEVKEILREKDEAWVNLHPSSPTWLEDGKSFLWMTECREESPRTLLVDVDDQWMIRKRAITGELAEWGPVLGARSISGVNSAADIVYTIDGLTQPMSLVSARRLNSGNSPVDSSSGESRFVWARTSSAVVGTDGTTLVETVADMEGAQKWVVRRVRPYKERPEDAKRRADALKRDPDSTPFNFSPTLQLDEVGRIASVAESPPFVPKLELTSVRVPGVYDGDDARGPLSVMIVRPHDFDKSKKYPVLDFAYAGPHSKTVNAAARNYLLHQWFADQGFIVVCIDGRGTPDKGRAWERAIKNNLIDVALSDHCAALEELCKQYPEMDRSRIGVNGWSFGGYFAAMAVMRRPDVYKAGVAGAPVVDWRDYDTHYTERYMGMPLPSDQLTDGMPGNVAGYDASSVLTYAKDLSVPFLLIHGTADDNVYFVHSMKLCDALVRAKKDFEFMPLPGQTHGVSKPEWVEAVQTRIAGFFMRHLQSE